MTFRSVLLALTLTLALALAAGPGPPARAHHAFVMYDQSRTIALTGEVESFQLDNPHSRLTIAVLDRSNRVQTWLLEMGPTIVLTAGGWTAQTLARGDKVTVRLHPMRDGSHGGQFLGVQLPNGRSLTGGPKPSGGRGFDFEAR